MLKTKSTYFSGWWFNSEFRKYAKMPEVGMWKGYFDAQIVNFGYPNDLMLNGYINRINDNLDLILVGLGEEDVMLSNKCSHALSATVKYMMPTMTLENNSCVVYDSVAGADMLNYGVYFGFDVMIVSVESHINSIKVAKQLDLLVDKQGLRLNFVLNKYNPANPLIQEFETQYSSQIIGKIPTDLAVIDYDYSRISPETISSLSTICANIAQLPMVINPLQKLQAFEAKKVN